MVAAGHDAYLVDWGAPDGADASLGLDGHVTERLLPLLAALPRPPILVGYCLGGSLALGAAALVPTAAVATIAAPWRFSHFPAADLELIASLWSGAKAMCQRIGYVPMEVLQSGFWAMDPARTIRKFAAFADADEALIHEFCTSLLEKRRISDDLYGRAMGSFGERGLIDLMATLPITPPSA